MPRVAANLLHFRVFCSLKMDSDGPTKAKKAKLQGPEMHSKAWHIMSGMGYEAGKGLGAMSQGRTEPVTVQTKHDRRGVGGGAGSHLRDSTTGDFPRGPHAWTEETEEVKVDGDLVYEWSRWTGEKDVDDLPHLALEGIQGGILPPTSPDALGPPVCDLGTQTRYCSSELLQEVLQYKNCLDNMPRDLLTSARIRSNPFEEIRKGIFMNRAAMKMANMDSLTNGLFSQAAPPHEILHFADICAGPGGFSEYLTWRRGASALAAAESTTGNSAAALFPRVRGYGMTLSGSCDFRLDNFLAGPAEVFRPFYGPKQDGDITSWANLEGFANLIHKNTDGRGVHVVMADGGFDASSGYNLQEVQSKHIYLCQCLCALTLLRPSGSFVTKLFDVVTDFSVDLIWLMSHVFKKVSLIKPVTSRPANSERYLLCEGLITSSSGMAGCPRAPSKASSSDGRAEPAVNEGEFKRRPRGLKVDYSCGYCYPSTPAHTHGTESGQFDSTSAVGTLIQHFLAVSEELHARSTGESTASNQECLDVLRLASDAALCNDTGFKTFITNANDKIAENQCIYLTKLLTYAQDATLEDTNQKSIRDACLAKWKVPSVERHSVPWPLWPSNIHKVLDSIIGNFPRTFSPELLPDDLKRPSKVPAFSPADLYRRDFNQLSMLALVLAAPHLNGSNELPRPMMVLSCGVSSQTSCRLKYTYDGSQWDEFSNSLLHFNPRLPAASLVWALPVNTYCQCGLRRSALVVLDAAFLYGVDLRSLHYQQRYVLAETQDFS
uniref:Cap-specific mRNA (nucleoside-2'-O-)-methyltransferase 1 n=1 Tax=Mesocestoides corti TaxID=53468 RepID=A0A5K3F1B7_MESCO